MMNLKHFIYGVCLAGVALASCQTEDELENVVDTSSPYVLDYLADSTDEIDQRRYAIFQKYGVPVFLNDVITEEVVGTDYKGDPIYKRETLDIAWDFYSDPNTSYQFVYLITEDEEIDPNLPEDEKAALEAALEAKRAKELANAHLALDYVETYLEMAGNTKPFSIMLLKTLVYDGSVREFYNGNFRTLYIGNACNYPEAADQRMRSGEIINASVLPLVQKNKALIEEFEIISEEKHYYNKQWQADLGEKFSEELTALTSVNIGLKLNNAFDRTFVNSLVNHVYLYYAGYYGMPMAGVTAAAGRNLYGNAELVQAEVNNLVAMAAKYGFVGGGWSNETTWSPIVDKDLEAYVKTIFQLGVYGFEVRYGDYPLVMQKFNIISDYIENELGIDLKYNNVN